MTGVYEFLQAWGCQKLESMKGYPIKNYVMLVTRLNAWQAQVSRIPMELITRGRLLLLSCHDIQAEMRECCLASLLVFLKFYLFVAALGLRCCTQPFSACSEWGLLSSYGSPLE